MEKIKALDIAKWFIKNDLDNPRNTYDGNMKLQKLLYFAQLIHVAKFGELLFSEEMRAYKNGTVINDVRLVYRDKHYTIVEQAEESVEIFNVQEVNETLQLTAEVFGEMTARELSALNHELISWNIPHNESKTDVLDIYRTEKSVIHPHDGLFMEDVRKVNQMLDAYEENNNPMDFEVVNGVTFYYDSNDMEITEDILNFLQEREFPDETYTLTNDREQGLIIL